METDKETKPEDAKEARSEEQKAPAAKKKREPLVPQVYLREEPPILLFHGTGGVGKTTLASMFPGAIFMFTENGQRDHKVATLQAEPYATFDDLMSHMRDLWKAKRDGEKAFEHITTIVTDTLDKLQKLMEEDVSNKVFKGQAFSEISKQQNFQKYDALKERAAAFSKALMRLRNDHGMAIVGLAHSAKSDNPHDVEGDGPQIWQYAIDKRMRLFWEGDTDAIGYIYHPQFTDEETGKTTSAKYPTITFKKNSFAETKTNYGLGEYRIKMSDDLFGDIFGSIPFYASKIKPKEKK